MSEAEAGHDAESPPVDPKAFAELFFAPKENREQIWLDMSRLVRHAAREIRGRSAAEMDDFKGEALAHAIGQIPRYDPQARTAYFYFYRVIQKNLLKSVSRPKLASLGDTDAAVCFNDLDSLSEKALDRELTRNNFPNNWNSYRLASKKDRETTERYFRVRYRRAIKQFNKTDSKPERAALAVMIETLKRARRDLVG